MTKNLASNKYINELFPLKLMVIVAFLGLIALSPSLKIIPKSLIITSFHDSQRLVELVLVGLIMLLVICSKQSLSFFTQNKARCFITFTFITLAIASSLLAISTRHALIEATLLVGLSYLALFTASLYKQNPALLVKQLIYAFLASILLSMLSFYTGYITAIIFNTPIIWPNPLTGFSNIRSFNQYQLWTFGLITLPLLAFDFKSASIRILLNSILVAWFVLLFFSASRGALLAWGLGVIITAIIYKKIAWPFIRLQLTYVSLGYLSYTILFELVPYLRGSDLVAGTVLRETTSDRITLWSQAIQLIQNHPILGVGPMHFAWFSSTYAHPHNSVLQLMCEWGLPAALIILSTASYGLWCWLKKVNIKYLASCDPLNRHLGVVLFFTLITSAIYSLVDGVIVMPISQVMMFTVIGLMMGYAGEKLVMTDNFNSTALMRSVFLTIVLITLIWTALPEILQSASGSEKRLSIGYSAAGPRLWTEVKPNH